MYREGFNWPFPARSEKETPMISRDLHHCNAMNDALLASCRPAGSGGSLVWI